MQLAYKTKKPHLVWGFSSCTRGRTRTGTVLLPTDFKSVVSTNSTTQAINFSKKRRRPDSNRRITVLQTGPLNHLGTTPIIIPKLT